MRTTHLVPLVLTIASIIDASGSTKKIKRSRNSPPSTSSSSSNSQNFLNHRLLNSPEFPVQIISRPEVNGLELLANNIPIEDAKNSSHVGSSSSSALKSSNKRKNSPGPAPAPIATEEDNKFDLEDDVVNAKLLSSLSCRKATVEDLEAGPVKPAKKVRKLGNESQESYVPKLLKMTDAKFNLGKIKSFELYFDESNFSTEGTDFLVRCLAESRFFGLAEFLIMNGARLPMNEAVFNAMISAKDGLSTVAIRILRAYIETHPVESTELFVEAVEQDESFDSFFASLLSDDYTSVIFKSSNDCFEAFKLIAKSGKMPMTMALIVDEDIAKSFIVKAIEEADADLIDTILDTEVIRAQDQIFIKERDLSIICHLFGKIESNKIISLIQKYHYDLSYTHDSSINPEGDILSIALAGKDLKSFKKLLLLGASLNLKLTLKSGEVVGLRDYAAQKRQDIHQIIESFDNNTLQAEVEAEDEADALASVHEVEMQQSSSSLSSSLAAITTTVSSALRETTLGLDMDLDGSN